MAQNPASQILSAAERVHHLAGQHVFHHCVHSEIPAYRGLFRPDKGVYRDFKIPVSPPCGTLHTGHRDIQAAVRQTVYAEACPHDGTPADAVQDRRQMFRRDTVHFQIHIL